MFDESESCKQLLNDELGFLKAMYTSEELKLIEPVDYQESGQVTQLILHQDVSGLKYEVVIELSSEYPVFLKPAVFVRSSSSINCTLLNRELRCFIENEILGIPLILNIIQWIRDNITQFQTRKSNFFSNVSSTDTSAATTVVGEITNKDGNYARFWIYSHHIYSKTKRRKIEESAAMHHLNGFFCPGKPGVIIVEGFRKDCDKFWDEIRTLNWRRIVLRHFEEQNDPSFFRLGKFGEVQIPHTEYLSELKRILVEADLEYGFALLLNL